MDLWPKRSFSARLRRLLGDDADVQGLWLLHRAQDTLTARAGQASGSLFLDQTGPFASILVNFSYRILVLKSCMAAERLFLGGPCMYSTSSGVRSPVQSHEFLSSFKFRSPHAIVLGPSC